MKVLLKQFVVVAGGAAVVAATSYGPHQPWSSPKPNFIFIMTDDQDLRLNSLNYMPSVQKHFTEQGTTFSNHFATVSLCCPSRVSLLTGRAAHNTNVTDVGGPYGGYPKFVSEGWNDNYLPLWLQAEGYNTYATGKIMNGFSTTTYNDPWINGWTSHDLFVDPNTYIYYNASFQRDQDEPVLYPGNYSTDLVSGKALGYLNDAIQADKPFFLGVMPMGPHAQTVGAAFTPPVPAARHADLYPGLKTPRTVNFNPDVMVKPTGGGWIKTLEQFNETVAEYFDNWYRMRILALQAVDDMVDAIMARLEASPDVLKNTYIIYTADNGYHIGQHRLAPGKTCGIEEDINVPFIIRGPGIEKGKTAYIPTSHTDIVPTLFQLADIPLQDEFDGEPIPLTLDQANTSQKSEHVNVEYWGTAVVEGIYPGEGSLVQGSSGINNTYKTARIIGNDYSFSYTVWCSNDHELYDMTVDPGQLINLYGTTGTVNGWPLPQLTARIDALLLTLKSCEAKVCRRPWEALHPQGNVHNLGDAMDPKFDAFYASQPGVSYTACMLGYLPEYEGALSPIPFGSYAGNFTTGLNDSSHFSKQ
ncbi:arylsulfatase precursor [Xylariales sp. PMI_506]|nr:arylsulfatase precursor [Xylariales sp. PMI_506]